MRAIPWLAIPISLMLILTACSNPATSTAPSAAASQPAASEAPSESPSAPRRGLQGRLHLAR